LKVIEIVERVGSERPNEILAYIKDAYNEIADLIPEKTAVTKISVVSGTKAYSLPTSMIRLLGVYSLNENSKYIEIDTISELNIYTD